MVALVMFNIKNTKIWLGFILVGHDSPLHDLACSCSKSKPPHQLLIGFEGVSCEDRDVEVTLVGLGGNGEKGGHRKMGREGKTKRREPREGYWVGREDSTSNFLIFL